MSTACVITVLLFEKSTEGNSVGAVFQMLSVAEVMFRSAILHKY